jgi:ATP-binding cassette subfamily B protein
MISVFGVAASLVLYKKLTIGELVALLGIAGNIIPSVNRLVVSNIQIQEALVAFDRMFEFTAMERQSATGEFSIQLEELSIDHVSFRFPGRKQILKDVSLKIKKGEMVALLGESGGGKSTMMQIVQKFYAPEAGTIKVNEQSLESIDTFAWRSGIGCVPQEIKIFNGNLLYNITISDQPEDYQRAVQFCFWLNIPEII